MGKTHAINAQDSSLHTRPTHIRSCRNKHTAIVNNTLIKGNRAGYSRRTDSVPKHTEGGFEIPNKYTLHNPPDSLYVKSTKESDNRAVGATHGTKYTSQAMTHTSHANKQRNLGYTILHRMYHHWLLQNP